MEAFQQFEETRDFRNQITRVLDIPDVNVTVYTIRELAEETLGIGDLANNGDETMQLQIEGRRIVGGSQALEDQLAVDEGDDPFSDDEADFDSSDAEEYIRLPLSLGQHRVYPPSPREAQEMLDR